MTELEGWMGGRVNGVNEIPLLIEMANPQQPSGWSFRKFSF